MRRTGASIIVTRRGEPIAEVIPPSLANVGESWLGAMRGTATIAGELVSPAGDVNEWDALRS